MMGLFCVFRIASWATRRCFAARQDIPQRCLAVGLFLHFSLSRLIRTRADGRSSTRAVISRKSFIFRDDLASFRTFMERRDDALQTWPRGKGWRRAARRAVGATSLRPHHDFKMFSIYKDNLASFRRFAQSSLTLQWVCFYDLTFQSLPVVELTRFRGQ